MDVIGAAEIARGDYSVEPGKKKVIVVSHERSGTHFLMNSIEENFSYLAHPRIDLDVNLAINFYSRSQPIFFLMKTLHDKGVRNIFKSHHDADQLGPLLHYLSSQYHVFYIYRDPRDVMASFWRFINGCNANENAGPSAKSVGAFMRAAPQGAMMRYQSQQAPTVLDRWKAHVEGWIGLPSPARDHVVFVSYESLHFRFAETMQRIAARMGTTLTNPVRPIPNKNTIAPEPPGVGIHEPFFTAEDQAFVRQVAGDTMARVDAFTREQES